MILLYDQNGDIQRIQVGECINVASIAADGYMVCNPGGKRELPAGLLPFNLDELELPVMAEAVSAAVYDETKRFYIAEIEDIISLIDGEV